MPRDKGWGMEQFKGDISNHAKKIRSWGGAKLISEYESWGSSLAVRSTALADQDRELAKLEKEFKDLEQKVMKSREKRKELKNKLELGHSYFDNIEAEMVHKMDRV